MNITKFTSKGKSNFPYIVETRNTENWNSVAAFSDEWNAIKYAEQVAKVFPKLPIRVHHYTGGPMEQK